MARGHVATRSALTKALTRLFLLGLFFETVVGSACASVVGMHDLYLSDSSDAVASRGPSDGAIVADGASTSDAPTGVGEEASSDGGSVLPANGHRYLLVLELSGITWSAAKTRAEALGGHLATISSATENDFVFQLMVQDRTLNYVRGEGAWLGGLQPSGSSEPAGGWRWVTGETWTYTAWANGEPNNVGGDEDSLCFYSSPDKSPTWADVPQGLQLKAFLVEFE